MAIRVALNHETVYRFDRPVQVHPHVVRLRPAPHCRTPVHRYSLTVDPPGHFINWQQDPFGNYLARLVFPNKLPHLRLVVDLVADMTVINPFDFFLEESAERYPFRYEPGLAAYLGPYLEKTEHGPLLGAWLEEMDLSERGTADFLVDVNRRLQSDVAYSVRMEPGVQTCEETLSRAIGSCRDTGWLLVQVLRHLGIAARFVSGYLVQLKADQESLDGPSGTAVDFTDLHAWAEAYVPGAGWVGLDPTSGLFAGEGHIPLACAPDPAGAAPITGSTAPCEVEFGFVNHVQRVHEDPRVTLPYAPEQWAAIEAAGEAVDERLDAGDVRLTMGGEPTFVSIDDMDGAEWNTAALGEHKSERALALAHRLEDCFASGGFMHFGQGKWYPGEPLPRWALTCYWREDGAPLWQRADLLDDGRKRSGAAAGAPPDPERFGRELATALGVEPSRLLPAYEDTLYYLWREGTVPPDVDIAGGEWAGGGLSDPLERDRLRRVLGGKLGVPVGYALPLDHETGRWRSSRWRFRREHMFLIPGDSAMGYRLPLDSLERAGLEETPGPFELDPFAPRGPLPDPAEIVAQRREASASSRHGGHGPSSSSGDEPETPDARRPASESIVRTALCLEVRDGILHVFLPPLPDLECAVNLLAALEVAAERTATAVRMEGYPLPEDHRLRQLQITPDPGVIEVNVQPARSWPELVELTTTLYAQARLARLGTEKFMLDGRHTGTGGGNHVTLGAAEPESSPLLRRPQLLASLVTYWQHHPSLSYLFSGAFIGPTSQAPRVDEARDDTLYEMEIALGQAHALGEGEHSPWQVDRVFRNILIDVTGNTHRAEFCIDKLYSPDSASGRRGLLELRAFEMPPHPHMSLVQMLLLRALVARFWDAPYRERPVRWGTALHDRFMLPHYVWSDLSRVVEEIAAQGLAFELDWFKPFLEFRFPRYGTVQVDDIELELRFAIEPWHVLGEEVGAHGTSRYVDSSVERLQVRVTGFANERYAVTCNGRRVPLRATGTPGEFVAGVRYKAWDPPSALHPTLDAEPTLVFDVVDMPNQRAIGGCAYHVAHPGGRSYDTFPVNAAEAEARRIARFTAHGHTPGPCRAPVAIDNASHPFTLDLRATSRKGT